MNKPAAEPRPVWPDAPRYAPGRAFPPYRFVPGLNPHPTEHPDGHSVHATHRPVTPLDENWRTNDAYLTGFDLYHQGYFWEAHEAWEGLWRLATDDSVEKHLLHALILNAAAQLKWHVEQRRGATTHSRNACNAFEMACNRAGSSLAFGIDLPRMQTEMSCCYGALWDEREDLQIRAPRFIINV